MLQSVAPLSVTGNLKKLYKNNVRGVLFFLNVTLYRPKRHHCQNYSVTFIRIVLFAPDVRHNSMTQTLLSRLSNASDQSEKNSVAVACWVPCIPSVFTYEWMSEWMREENCITVSHQSVKVCLPTSGSTSALKTLVDVIPSPWRRSTCLVLPLSVVGSIRF